MTNVSTIQKKVQPEPSQNTGSQSRLSSLTWRDRFESFLCRTNNTFRMNYLAQPGLYTIGTPDKDSPVLVTCNYRLTLTVLRKALAARSVWILVIDTKGINVWCAAGKGTFCTKEIVKQIAACNLHDKVSHRILILPQLGASGVSAYKLQKESGFTVKFGPVGACDIGSYIDNKYKATPAMRRVLFPLHERAKLVPMEAIPALKQLGIFLFIAMVLYGLTKTGIMYKQAITGVWPLALAGFCAVCTGSVLSPLLLPFIPGRAFSVKGFILGLIGAVVLFLAVPVYTQNPFLAALCLFALPVYSSFLAFLFTGSTTYTSPSGVKKELKTAWPLYRIAVVISFILFVCSIIRFWRII